VVFDIFYVGTDQLAAQYMLEGGYFSIREKPLVAKADLEQAVAVLNVIDCKSLAQATLQAVKELDDYKVSFLIAVLGVALALARGSPLFSRQSAGYVEGANALAAGLLPAYTLQLEHKLGREIKMIDPIAPWLVNSVGWVIARFESRSRGGSPRKMLCGKKHSGEIAEMGEQ
ncbi:unnamed protein product, partial [Prorocentrum cordatum]